MFRVFLGANPAGNTRARVRSRGFLNFSATPTLKKVAQGSAIMRRSALGGLKTAAPGDLVRMHYKAYGWRK